MRVLHLLKSDRFSGAENVACQIIEMFKSNDNVEMVYCSQDGTIREALEERNIKFCPMKKLCVSEVKRVLKKEKPDLIHAHDFSASVIASLTCKNIPIISHIHSNPPWIKNINMHSIFYFLTHYRYKKIFTVSKSVMNEYIFGYKLNNKVHVIGNPINIEAIKNKANKASINESSDVMFLGRLSEAKNPILFVDIINELRKKIPNIKAIMVGNGELYDQVSKRIDEFNLGDVITMYGFQDNPYGLLKNTKVLCMPSSWEGYGLAAVEALSLGKPVICNRVGGLPSIVDDSCGNFCTNKFEYAKIVEKLLTNINYYQKMSKNAILKSLQLDNYEAYANNIKSNYAALL